MTTNSSMALLESQALLHCARKAVLYDVEMTLGKRIKTARERLRPKLTQGDLGAKFGVTDKAISGWERGIDRPDVDKIRKLARILKVPTDWLLEGTGPPPDPDAVSVVDQLDERERALIEDMALAIIKRRSAAA